MDDDLKCDVCGVRVDSTDGWTDGVAVLCGPMYGHGCSADAWKVWAEAELAKVGGVWYPWPGSMFATWASGARVVTVEIMPSGEPLAWDGFSVVLTVDGERYGERFSWVDNPAGAGMEYQVPGLAVVVAAFLRDAGVSVPLVSGRGAA